MKKTQGNLRKICIIVFTCSKKWIKMSEGDDLPLKNTSPISSQLPVHSALTLMSNSSVLNMIQRWAHEKKKKTVASLVRVCLPPPDLLGYATPQALWEDRIHGFFQVSLTEVGSAVLGSMFIWITHQDHCQDCQQLWKICFWISNKAQF